MGEKGVLLRSWRVGTDLMGEAERLIKEDERKRKRENGRGSDNGRGR
jgi:hypothetical protein